jgi:FMN-dependent NADH-azoreductase
MKLLHIDASVLGENSVSRQLSAAIVKRLREAEPATEITYYDLAAKPIDQLTGPVFAAIQGVSPGTPPCCRSSLSVRRRLKTFLPPTSSLSVPRCTTSQSPHSSRPGSTGSSSAARPSATPEVGPEGLAGGKKLSSPQPVAVSMGQKHRQRSSTIRKATSAAYSASWESPT